MHHLGMSRREIAWQLPLAAGRRLMEAIADDWQDTESNDLTATYDELEKQWLAAQSYAPK